MSSLLTVVNLMFSFIVGDIKSATVSSQLTKMKNAKMKKMQVVNLLLLPFNSPHSAIDVLQAEWPNQQRAQIVLASLSDALKGRVA